MGVCVGASCPPTTLTSPPHKSTSTWPAGLGVRGGAGLDVMGGAGLGHTLTEVTDSKEDMQGGAGGAAPTHDLHHGVGEGVWASLWGGVPGDILRGRTGGVGGGEGGRGRCRP